LRSRLERLVRRIRVDADLDHIRIRHAASEDIVVGYDRWKPDRRTHGQTRTHDVSGKMRLAAIFVCALAAAPGAANAPLLVTAQFEHGPQRPSSVPILPGLNVGRNPFGKLVGQPIGKAPYDPLAGDSFRRHNGPSAYNYV